MAKHKERYTIRRVEEDRIQTEKSCTYLYGWKYFKVEQLSFDLFFERGSVKRDEQLFLKVIKLKVQLSIKALFTFP